MDSELGAPVSLQSPPAQPPGQFKSNRSVKWIVGSGLVIVVIVGGVLIYRARHQSQNDAVASIIPSPSPEGISADSIFSSTSDEVESVLNNANLNSASSASGTATATPTPTNTTSTATPRAGLPGSGAATSTPTSTPTAASSSKIVTPTIAPTPTPNPNETLVPASLFDL